MSNDESSTGDDRSLVVRALQAVTPTPIRRRFTVKFGLVLLVMALSVGAIGIAATQSITAQTEENVEEEYRTLAGQEASLVEQWIERNRLFTELLADNQELAGEDPVGTLREEAEKTGQDVEALHVLRGAGASVEVVGSHDKLGRDFAQSDGREWLGEERFSLASLDAGEVYVSETYATEDSQFVGFVSPLTGAGDRYLLLEVSVRGIQNQLAGDSSAGFTQVVAEGSNTVILDGRGDEGSVLEPYATDDAVLEPVTSGAALRGSSDPKGVTASVSGNDEVIDEEYIAGYSPVEASLLNYANWVVVTHEPRSSAFGVVDALSTWGLLVTAFAVVLIGVTGSTLGYSTSSSIDRLTKKTKEMRKGNLAVDLSSSRIDEIGQLYDGFAEMRDALEQQIGESQQARKEAEVARAEAEEMATYLQGKAEEYSAVMQEVGAGDMTRRMEPDGEEESMDRIAEEFNEMIGELEKTTGQLKNYVDEVESAGAEVEQSSATVREASEQVAESIQKISDDAHGQQERLERTAEMMDDVLDRLGALDAQHQNVSMDEPLAEIREAYEQIDELARLSEETMAESENVAGAAEEQAAELNEVSERANDLQQYAQPIRDILDRFETDSSHEFIFSIGPGSPGSPSTRREDD